MNFIKKIPALALLVFIPIVGAKAQTNKSTEENYRKRIEHVKYDYATQFDNGFITLRDGTTLFGKISLVGSSYSNLRAVIIRTNSGKRYSLRLRSIKEYGLVNSLTNDTPDLFSWVQLNEKSAINGYQDIRTGTCGFGYVKLQDGKTKEGELTIKEVNGRIKNIQVKNGSDKTKYKADLISNFGVKRYEDPKFDGVWSIVQWKKSVGTGMLVNQKSVPAYGKVTKTDGSTSSGFIMIVKKNEITTQLKVSATVDAKPSKIKYADVKSYTIEQKIADYTNMLKNLDQPYEQIHPSRKFFKGSIMLINGSVIEGQVAKAANSDYTDVFFATDENSVVKGYSAEEVDQVYQEIPQDVMVKYNAEIYDRDHAQDFLIQRPAQWKIQSKTENLSLTEFQQGYVTLPSGEEKVGAISVTKNGAYTTVELLQGDEKTKYRNKDFVDYGLIESQPTTAFRSSLFTGMFKRKVPGYVKLLGSEEIIKGDLKIKTKSNGFTGDSEQVMLIDDKKFKLETIEFYGLIDVPVSDMTRNGSYTFSDRKLNFHPGSFKHNGVMKEGVIAWTPPNGAGVSNAIFYAESMEGVANIYYLKDGVTDIVQNIPPVIEEEDQLIDTEDAEQVFRGQGYILKKNGEKIEGELQVVHPPGTWFAPEIALIKSDSSITVFSNDPEIKGAFVNVNGKEKEYLNYENVFVEVLDRDSVLVHFRNPFPTIETVGGKLLNDLIQGRQADFNEAEAAEAALAEREGRLDMQVTLNIPEIKIYALENLIYDESTGRVTMYAPAPNFYVMMDAELEGCIEYLTMSFDEKWGLRRMKSPIETLKFLNENMNN